MCMQLQRLLHLVMALVASEASVKGTLAISLQIFRFVEEGAFPAAEGAAPGDGREGMVEAAQIPVWDLFRRLSRDDPGCAVPSAGG